MIGSGKRGIDLFRRRFPRLVVLLALPGVTLGIALSGLLIAAMAVGCLKLLLVLGTWDAGMYVNLSRDFAVGGGCVGVMFSLILYAAAFQQRRSRR